MSKIDTLFQNLRSSGRKAFMPFVTAGDPDLQFTADVIRELVSRGADLCELGIPYSDPVADGPVIQASYTRALNNKVKLSDIFATCEKTTAAIDAPIVTMVSYSIVLRRGLERYVVDAKNAGVSGAIVPDLPVDEANELRDVCRKEDFSLIQLITPTTPRDRAKRIAENTSGFIYYVSVTGITGERTELPASVVEAVAWLKSQTELPICIGFGISKPEHVKMLAPVADGLIVGSAVVRRMAEVGQKDRAAVLNEIGDYAAELIAAIRN